MAWGDHKRKLWVPLGLEVFDLLLSYDGIDGRELAVVPFSNPHPSVLAHQIAAESIVEELEGLSAEHGLW